MSAATRTEERSLEPKRLRRVLVGRPMQTGQIHETLLPKWLALPIFASDPLSSVAYATESALVVLVAAVGDAPAHLVFPISIAIACLLAIVVLSYRQTVRVYETSGGAYVVARENLGTTAEPRRGRRAADRLRAHGRGLDLGRHLRDHVVRSLARPRTRSGCRSPASW